VRPDVRYPAEVDDIEGLADLARYAQQQVERIERMQAELAEQAAEGVSSRGYVRARTGPGGALLDLSIDPLAQRLSNEELVAEVRDAVTMAQRRFAEIADQIMAPVLGMRPSEQSAATFEQGMQRLDALGDDLNRLARRHGLAG
jgi:DNA-binding protein YbaB